LKAVETKDGVFFYVHVKPKSGQFKTVVDGEDIIIYCSEEPVGGKVNKELVNKLSKLFHKKVELVSGFTSKDTRLLVRNAVKIEIEQVLSRQ
jgi:uncharacterized protein (TIGR00251 family)